jgi:hypothetical protein
MTSWHTVSTALDSPAQALEPRGAPLAVFGQNHAWMM